MSTPSPDMRTPPSARLAAYYAVLVVLVAVVVSIVLISGRGKHAQPAIAGGYGVSAGAQCFGAKLEIAQSGQFVSIGNAASTLVGNLTFRHGHLTGTVGCVDRTRAAIDARFADGTLRGTIAGRAMAARLQTPPPPAGTPKALAPGSIGGSYLLAPSSVCLGGAFTLTGSGSRFELATSQGRRGAIGYHAGVLQGTVTCVYGGERLLSGTAAGRALDLMLVAPAGASGPAPEQVAATLQRSSDGTVAAFFLAALVVMLFARLCGSLMPRLGQPRVMGEVLAGILLGPTLFGALDPALQAKVFPSDIVPYIGVAANLGLIFYMFLIGLEVDLDQVRARLGMTVVISNTGLLVPFVLGMAGALPLYGLLAPDTRFVAFALFMGVSMSVTAFPVLARIISERRMLKRPLGILALAAAAIDDVSAWFLVALAPAVAGAGSGIDVLRTIGLTAAFVLVMALAARPLLARAAVAYEEVGRLPAAWTTIIFAGVLLCAVTTDWIGVAVIFGAFVMGLAMPRHAGLSDDVARRVEDFVLTLLLPLFYAYTGLRTDIGLLDRPALILVTLGLIAIAIAGKYGGTLIAARSMRLPWRESAVLGVLMNTRGLTELIVLNIALDAGVISATLFTALVMMALVTTFMAGPILRLIDPRNSFGSPLEEELATASRLTVADLRAPTSAILVAPQSDAALESLLGLATPLARWEPRRELILARLVQPPRGSTVRGGLQTEARLVQAASRRVQQARLSLLDQGVSTRAVTLTSANPGADLVRLSSGDEVDLLLLDGRRPLLGDGIPREDVGTVLREASCDVAVLVAREGARVVPDRDALVIVPFGGAEHDWAALELASWLCAATGASLQLLGPPGRTVEGKDASHMLANAALLVQQFAGVSTTGVVAQPGREGIVQAASRANLLVMGLSERWRKEGLGETRKALAQAAPAPIVFVRRGERPGALAPAGDATRFAWSAPDLATARAFSRSMSALNLPAVTRSTQARAAEPGVHDETR